MPCYIEHTKDGDTMFLCGDLGPHCAADKCAAVSGWLCDYPVGEGKTCDLPLCGSLSSPVTFQNCLVRLPLTDRIGRVFAHELHHGPQRPPPKRKSPRRPCAGLRGMFGEGASSAPGMPPLAPRIVFVGSLSGAKCRALFAICQ